eukprot:9471601-Lingulodinium_polyedra.AAC.1
MATHRCRVVSWSSHHASSELHQGLLSVVGHARHPPDSGARAGSAVGIARVPWCSLEMDPWPQVQGSEDV